VNAAEALAYITRRLHPDDHPALDAGDVASLLELAAVVDDDGLCPSDADWTPTYGVPGVYRAIAEGWAMKRGKVVGHFDFTTDGQMFRRSQTSDHIDAEERKWRAKVQSSPLVLGDFA
jgi:hypothetical protein